MVGLVVGLAMRVGAAASTSAAAAGPLRRPAAPVRGVAVAAVEGVVPWAVRLAAAACGALRRCW